MTAIMVIFLFKDMSLLTEIKLLASSYDICLDKSVNTETSFALNRLQEHIILLLLRSTFVWHKSASQKELKDSRPIHIVWLLL